MSTIRIVVRAYERVRVLHLKMNLAIRQGCVRKKFSSHVRTHNHERGKF